MDKLKRLNIDWSLIAFLYIAAKSFIVPTIHWSETLGIVLVLVVHYGKRLIPEKKTFVQYEEDFFGMLKDIESRQKAFSEELSSLKLTMGLKQRPKA